MPWTWATIIIVNSVGCWAWWITLIVVSSKDSRWHTTNVEVVPDDS